jgi:hypothetical protein
MNDLPLGVQNPAYSFSGGKSPPPNEQSNGHGKPNPMQDEIGNRAARPMVSGTSHPFYKGIISIAEILDE